MKFSAIQVTLSIYTFKYTNTQHWESQHNDERGEGFFLMNASGKEEYSGSSDDTDYDGATL